MKKLKFVFDNKEITATIADKNPKTADAIWNSLPLESTINTWGEEIYFGVAVKVGEENAQEEVEVGDVAYWPEGRCICIFFGRTPASKTDRPKAYSPVNVFAKVESNLKVLKTAIPGSVIRVEKY